MGNFKFGIYCLTLLCFSISAEEDASFVGFFKKPLGSNTPPAEDVCSPERSEPCKSFRIGGDVAISYDYFRSLPDGSWAGNSGAFASCNLAISISKLTYGLGAQLGGSYGLYDWNGRGSNTLGNTTVLQQQAFITAGLLRMTPQCSGLNAGIVYDAMFNKEFGVFGLNPILGQMRAQIGYQIKKSNELGLWGTVFTQTSHKTTSEIPVQFRAISQINLFWTHNYENRAQTMLWVGLPYLNSLMYSSGRSGKYLVGASFKAPLTKAFSIIGHGSYMGSHSGTSVQEARNYAANVCFGLNYSFGGEQAGQRPYLPVADNSNFIVDTNTNE